ncbi:hypothetical protein ABT336_05610 [Micromonospora sp. NPDC000207]|uniref:hypothetical protein n=1 Tax=Micromonospora sp. NPDC000207 TaxID=3154246 RepID=UPI00331DC866
MEATTTPQEAPTRRSPVLSDEQVYELLGLGNHYTVYSIIDSTDRYLTFQQGGMSARFTTDDWQLPIAGIRAIDPQKKWPEAEPSLRKEFGTARGKLLAAMVLQTFAKRAFPLDPHTQERDERLVRASGMLNRASGSYQQLLKQLDKSNSDGIERRARERANAPSVHSNHQDVPGGPSTATAVASMTSPGLSRPAPGPGSPARSDSSPPRDLSPGRPGHGRQP